MTDAATGREILRDGAREGEGIDAGVKIKSPILEGDERRRDAIGDRLGREAPLAVGGDRRAEKLPRPVIDREGKRLLEARSEKRDRGEKDERGRERREERARASGGNS